MLVPVIGLEIHCELSTNSKVFCTCENEFGGEPNTRVCPVCMGLPGTLPVINQRAVEYTIRAGYALGCSISLHSEFDRKNYFYPDLPKAYQISELYEPICLSGNVTVDDDKGNPKAIRINRIHLEEDAGKLVHDDLMGLSLADYNRCGVPLIEIVTEPDISSAEEAANFVREIARRLRYAGVSDCRMEQGSLRVDVNLSLKEADATEYGTRTETKNLNSVKSVMRAIEFEIKRQTRLLEEGKRVVQETRSFQENSGQTKSLRSKEDAHDYRYFKDPDIQPVVVTETELEEIRKSLPVMPHERYLKYTKEYELSSIDAMNLIQNPFISDFYEATLKNGITPKTAANGILMELFRLLKDGSDEITSLPFTPEDFALLLTARDSGKITQGDAKKVLQKMYETGEKPSKIIQAEGMEVVNDTGEVDRVVAEVMARNETAVEQYRGGEQKVFGFLMGQCNKELKGKASPALVKERLEDALKA